MKITMHAETDPRIETIINSSIDSIKEVIPFAQDVRFTGYLKGPFSITDIGILIGVTGDVRGRIMLTGERAVIASVSEKMYGMQLEGEMLESFTSEITNMIAGSICSKASSNDLSMDISPPTLMVGEAVVKGVEFSYCIEAEFEKGQKMVVDLSLLSE